MRRALFGLAVLLTLPPTTGAFAADQRNVYVINGAGYGIKFLGFQSAGRQ